MCESNSFAMFDIPAPILRPRHVVIIGGGAGGVELALRLGRGVCRCVAQITLIDRNMAHFWKPRLHEVAAGLEGGGSGEVSYHALARHNGFAFQLGTLIHADPLAKTVTIDAATSDDGESELLAQRTLEYDLLVFALGSRVNDFGVPGVIEHCHMLDNVRQARALQRRLMRAAVKASAGSNEQLRVAIVGAGATGVELAAELHHAAFAAHRYGALGNPRLLSISLIDQAATVLPGAHPKTSARALTKLRDLGVNVFLGHGVRQASEEGFLLDDGTLVPAQVRIWASGVVGHGVVSSIAELTLTRGNRIAINDQLACIGVEDVYALGDCAASGEAPLPTTAQVAHQQAAFLARSIKARLYGKRSGIFTYRSRGMVVSLGNGDAAGEFPTRAGKRHLTTRGPITKLTYILLSQMHQATLHGRLRALALFVSDRLRGLSFPPIKLH